MVENQVALLEQTIQEIEGIEAARIVADGDGIEEIHVLSSTKKNVKQLARDIESAIIAKHGIAVDYRKISIAQVSADDGKVADTSRLKLTSVSVESSSSSCRVGVNLFFNEKDFEGIAKGSCSSTSKYRLVAEATLRAIEKACADTHLALEGLELVNFGSRSAFTACVTMIRNSREQLGLGCALKIDGLENESIVKAVLAAVNRSVKLPD